MALIGRFNSAEEALRAIAEHIGYRIEQAGDEWLVHLDPPAEPLGWPIGEEMREMEN
jgi:hypothetical protein